MSLVKIADRFAGRSLRWLFNLLTGNYFIHQERRMMAALDKLRDDIDISLAPLRLQHDEKQRELLDRYRSGE